MTGPFWGHQAPRGPFLWRLRPLPEAKLRNPGALGCVGRYFSELLEAKLRLPRSISVIIFRVYAYQNPSFDFWKSFFSLRGSS